MNESILSTQNEIPLKELRNLMKEVAEEARRKANIADNILNEKIKQELSDLINKMK